MLEALILIQSITQNFALMGCALFTGAATYVSLVERPAIEESGPYVASAYILFSQPRPTIYQSIFATLGGTCGILAAWTSDNIWWLAGGLVLLCAALINILVLAPQARELRMPQDDDAHDALAAKLPALSRQYALQAIAGLASLFIFVVKT